MCHPEKHQKNPLLSRFPNHHLPKKSSKLQQKSNSTLPETNIFAPENGCMVGRLASFWGPAYFQGRPVSFREGNFTFIAI